MSVLEILLLLVLTNGTILGVAALGYFILVAPMQQDIRELQDRRNSHQVPLPAMPYFAPSIPQPAGVLPSQEDLPDRAWEVGGYGDDNSTPEEVEDQMSEQLQTANREAEQSWRDLETLRHGKSNPLIYSGG